MTTINHKVTFFLFALLTLLFAAPTAQADDQDFGLSLSAGVKKKIVRGLNIGVSGEIRSQDNSSEIERLSLKLAFSYKPVKYFKLDTGYDFIEKYMLKSTTIKGNFLDSYWSPRHRFVFSATGILPIGDLEISLRERYQLTHRQKVTVNKYDEEDTTKKSDEVKTAKNSHYLRSHLAFAYHLPIKKTDLTPKISIELYDNLSDSFALDKIKLTLGVEYAISKTHGFEFFYRMTADLSDASKFYEHLVGAEYEYKF